MSDQKPPWFEGDERETLQAFLQYQRDSIVRKVVDLDEDAARRQLVASGTSLLWLVKHLTTAEVTWVLVRFANKGAAVFDDTLQPHDTLATALDAYRAAWALVDEVTAGAASLDEPCRGLDADPTTNLRWVLTHLVEETARHAGHADILRELIDGQTGR